MLGLGQEIAGLGLARAHLDANRYEEAADQARQVVRRGRVYFHPDARGIDIKHWIKKQAREQIHQDIAQNGQDAPTGKEMFNLIYAGPPWEFKTYSEKQT